jgi:hypothetical protein
MARLWQIDWNALEIGPEKETAANRSRWIIQLAGARQKVASPMPHSVLETFLRQANTIISLKVLCSDQATVAMRPCAWLAGVELALLARRGTTCGTSDSE